MENRAAWQTEFIDRIAQGFARHSIDQKNPPRQPKSHTKVRKNEKLRGLSIKNQEQTAAYNRKSNTKSSLIECSRAGARA